MFPFTSFFRIILKSLDFATVPESPSRALSPNLFIVFCSAINFDGELVNQTVMHESFLRIGTESFNNTRLHLKQDALLSEEKLLRRSRGPELRAQQWRRVTNGRELAGTQGIMRVESSASAEQMDVVNVNVRINMVGLVVQVLRGVVTLGWAFFCTRYLVTNF